MPRAGLDRVLWNGVTTSGLLVVFWHFTCVGKTDASSFLPTDHVLCPTYSGSSLGYTKQVDVGMIHVASTGQRYLKMLQCD